MTGAARVEIRAAEMRAASGRRLEGVAAVYGVPTTLPGGVVETIKPGAFAASLRGGADILFLADHDWSRVLGRTKSGTLTLRDTPAGLEFSVALPDTSAARDMLALAERGDLGGASVAMRVRADRWTGNRREVVEAELVECSAVASHAAYPQTSVVARARPGITLAGSSPAALRRIWEAL